MANFYSILGVRDFASLQEIKTAYRKLSHKLHPDHNNNDKFFEERFKEIQNAYEHLTNSQLKQKHDDFLKQFGENSYRDYSNPYNRNKNSQEKEKPSNKTADNPKPKKKRNTFSVKRKFNRKWYLLLLIPIIIVIYLTFEKKDVKVYEPTILEGAITKIILVGQAIDSAFNKQTAAYLELTEYPYNIFKCQGKFDEKEIYGKFEVTGGDINEVSDPNYLDLSLNGDIFFGNGEGSGIPPGTKAGFKMHLYIHSDIVKGSYIIEPIPNTPFSSQQQSGIFELKIETKIKYP